MTKIPRRIVGVLALLAAIPAAAQGPLLDQEVKVAFLFNFAKFVEWPPEAFEDSAPFRLCMLGEDPFGKVLDDMVTGKTVHDRELAVVRLSVPAQARACHLLFIGSSEDLKLKTIVKGLDGAHVLTVGDMARFSRRGGMIEFILEEKKMGFRINQERAAAAGLRISSQLLKLAKEDR